MSSNRRGKGRTTRKTHKPNGKTEGECFWWSDQSERTWRYKCIWQRLTAKQSDINSWKGGSLLTHCAENVREKTSYVHQHADLVGRWLTIALSIAFDIPVASLKELPMLTAGELGWLASVCPRNAQLLYQCVKQNQVNCQFAINFPITPIWRSDEVEEYPTILPK